MGRHHRPGATQQVHRRVAWPRGGAHRPARSRGEEVLAGRRAPGLRYRPHLRRRRRGPDRRGAARRRNRAADRALMAAMKPRPAATLALLRDASGGPQVLMLQRTQSAAFLGGAYVFAGGALDAGDDDGRIMARVRGLSVPTPPVAYWIAAIRECFEAGGIVLAFDGPGEFVGADRPI